MKEIAYIITDDHGVHARPAGELIKVLRRFKSAVTIKSNEKSADAKKILAVMGMGIKQGDEITLMFDGEDEKEASEAALKFLKENL